MTILHMLIVAAIQGITEFLPISSSGHLVLVPVLTEVEDHGLTVDVAAHLGSLLAVLIYFRRETLLLLRGAADILTGKLRTSNAGLVIKMAVATVPVVAAGALFLLFGIIDLLRNAVVIGWANILFGLVLYWTDRRGSSELEFDDWSLRTALIFGLWQALSLIPGASRSGVTISGARFAGFNRRDGVRIAMLMSIPTILAASLITGIEAYSSEGIGAVREAAVVAVLSFFFALATLSVMMRFLDRFRFTPYVIYRLALGAALILLI